MEFLKNRKLFKSLIAAATLLFVFNSLFWFWKFIGGPINTVFNFLIRSIMSAALYLGFFVMALPIVALLILGIVFAINWFALFRGRNISTWLKICLVLVSSVIEIIAVALAVSFFHPAAV